MSHSDAAPAASTTRRLGMPLGAAIGFGIGLLGPVVLALLAWAMDSATPDASMAGKSSGVLLWIVLAVPVVLLIGGCAAMFTDATRGWGLAALVAGTVWMLSSTAVGALLVIGSYIIDQAPM